MTAHQYALPEILEGAGAHGIKNGDHDTALRRLDEVATYGRDLWEQLRRLVDHLHTEATSLSASWSEADWDRWEAGYAGALDCLAGARGDSGYGAEQAATVRHGATGR